MYYMYICSLQMLCTICIYKTLTVIVEYFGSSMSNMIFITCICIIMYMHTFVYSLYILYT